MKLKTIAGSAVLCLAATQVAAEEFKIGFVTTLTTPAAVIGRDMVDAVNLSLEHHGAAFAGRKVTVVFEDDGFKPETGRQKVEKLVQSDEVDVVAGFIWSNVLLAAQRPALKSGAWLISTNAGPSELAGRLCHENFFSTRGQNDLSPMALGEQLNRDGVKTLYIMVPNYAAGKDMARGVETGFKGEVVGKDLTRWGADPQLDFSAELAKVKASGAEALMAFYPGRAGGAFFAQLERAGLGELPVYTVYTIDSISLPRMQKAGLSAVKSARAIEYWSPDLDNPANRRFVEGFRAAYGRTPSFYAAGAYDLIPYLKSALEAVEGDLSKREGIRAALRAADYDSVRGTLTYGANHYPINDYYVRRIVEAADGTWSFKVDGVASSGASDPYIGQCKL